MCLILKNNTLNESLQSYSNKYLSVREETPRATSETSDDLVTCTVLRNFANRNTQENETERYQI